ncbi:hypothetical protein ACFVIM_00520 [Streptomyces sp. NPDC057638]|uniref:hypothetical protein n=1 Tax=Streptomyces sp. NPDC057638 TaxID=3346190 RepID=UPI0036A17B40
MALIQPPMLVHGGTHPARAMRMMIRDLARGSAGVTEGNDLRVSPLSTPGAGVRVGDGSAVIRGATWGQGSYTQYNVGDATVPIAPTGAKPRSDLICLRVEDPEYEGNRNPATEDIGYFHVVSGVSSTMTATPAGMTAIPLARLDIPANTATITSAMIRDLRRIANPRRESTLLNSFPTASSTLKYNDNKWHKWPSAGAWNITIPSWATTAKIVVTVAGLRMIGGNVYARMRQSLGSDVGQETPIDDDQAHIRRSTVVLGDTVSISASARGTTQRLSLETYMHRSESGDLTVDDGTSFFCQIEFTEGVI